MAKSLISQRMQWNRRFTVAETVELLRPIAAALDFLHLTMTPPIIHCDVKPENILVPATSAQMESRALRTDFGISLVSEDERLTSFSMMMGTEKYFAPEIPPGGQCSGREGSPTKPTAATDNYTLALIAFEMLTLHPYRDTMSQAQWLQSNRPAPELQGSGDRVIRGGRGAGRSQLVCHWPSGLVGGRPNGGAGLPRVGGSAAEWDRLERVALSARSTPARNQRPGRRRLLRLRLGG